MSGKFRFAIDRGGTFTDVYAKCPNGKVRTLKLLSVDPLNYKDAPTEGIRRILEEETGQSLPKEEKVSCSQIEWIRMGTTVATNALLERKGEWTALLITKGFRDLLYIGNQARSKIFDLAIPSGDGPLRYTLSLWRCVSPNGTATDTSRSSQTIVGAN